MGTVRHGCGRGFYCRLASHSTELTTESTTTGVKNMKKLLTRFAKDESGVTAIEYGLIATLVGVAIIAGATLLGTTLDARFTSISGNL